MNNKTKNQQDIIDHYPVNQHQEFTFTLDSSAPALISTKAYMLVEGSPSKDLIWALANKSSKQVNLSEGELRGHKVKKRVFESDITWTPNNSTLCFPSPLTARPFRVDSWLN